MLQALDSLQIVSFLVLEEHLEGLEHLNQVVPLVDKVDETDCFVQLGLPISASLGQRAWAEIRSGVQEG